MTEHWLVSAVPGQAARFRLQPPGPIRIGRAKDSAVLLEGDRTVSRLVEMQTHRYLGEPHLG
jgi:hypothetical protein